MPEGQDKTRIMVVDDEESVRNVLLRTLESAGYDVTTAANGEEALQKMAMEKVAMVLLDVRMPKLSGTEALKEIMNRWSDTCIIMVTAVTDTTIAVEAMKMGAYDYITKPFDRADLVQKVQSAIGKWKYQLQEKKRYSELRERFLEKTQLMQDQFNELVDSLAREHNLLLQLAAKEPHVGKASLSALPRELQNPMSSVGEFREALLRILRRT